MLNGSPAFHATAALVFIARPFAFNAATNARVKRRAGRDQRLQVGNSIKVVPTRQIRQLQPGLGRARAGLLRDGRGAPVNSLEQNAVASTRTPIR